MKFHETKKSAAVLKHAIIDSYAPVFIGKTGSRSVDHRVSLIDGYAGPGRYDDGEEGSGAMLIRHAHKFVDMPRAVELHFVESDPETLEKLVRTVENEGSGLSITVHDGDISSHLPALLGQSDGVPLFVYLDPCGLVIPFDEVVQIFGRPGGYGSPATEVLINFSAVTLRRIAGHLTSDKAVEGTLARMDEVCGGPWWRDEWVRHLPDKDAAEAAVIAGYAARLSKAAGSGHWTVDVRSRDGLKPLYYLIFASRHMDGLEYFGEASSLGLEKWRRYAAEHDAEGTLFGDDDSWHTTFKTEEAKLSAEWVEKIAARLTDELAKGEPFRVQDRYADVFGDLIGIARNKHLRAAMKLVHQAGRTTTNPVGVDRLLALRLTPA